MGRRLAALLVLLLAASAASSQQAGCNCFPPEVQAKTAQETLQKAKVAVYGRFDGRELLVIESFKGPRMGTTMALSIPAQPCAALPPLAGEEVLLLAFEEPPTLCDLHPREHYLLGALRSLNR